MKKPRHAASIQRIAEPMIAYSPLTVGNWTDVSYWPVSIQAPTIFHITHAKSGSQWIHRMLHAIDYYRLVLPQADQSQFLLHPVQAGKIYPTLFITRQEFESVRVPENHRKFVVIRDLRDTMLSLCFSLLYSHAASDAMPGQIDDFRSRFDWQHFDEALMHTILTYGHGIGKLQLSWIQSDTPLFRYRDLLLDDLNTFRTIFNDICELNIPEDRLRDIVEQNRFQVLSGGRSQGNADAHNHYRNGMCGDWVHHFNSEHVRVFKDTLNDYLIATGYEKDRHW